MPAPSVSVVITTFDEGDELRRTIASVRRNTRRLAEIIVVDDGSVDGSTETLSGADLLVVRHTRRIGVACSRDEGSRLATGDVLCYLDAHQRVGRDCLDKCAQLAVDRAAIICPDIRDYNWYDWRLHGADFELCPRKRYFSARWRRCFAWQAVTRVTSLKCPPYLVPRTLYPRLAWSRSLAGWGASEASMAVKAFFTGTDIFNYSRTLARHRFQARFPYITTWDDVWQNQAVVARVCFDETTWRDYWLPRLFDARLNGNAVQLLESPEIRAEQKEFQTHKRRSDREFWTDLLGRKPPEEIR